MCAVSGGAEPALYLIQGCALRKFPIRLRTQRLYRWARRQGGFLLVTFLCRSKKSDSRVARNALDFEEEAKSKIKSTPPQSSPALRAREEARAKAKGKIKIKIKMDPSLRWDDGGGATLVGGRRRDRN
jgi:hypothetical protein